MDVWQVSTYSSSSSSGTTRTYRKTRSYICEEDGVYLIHEEWRNSVSYHTTETSEGEQDFPEGYLALPAELGMGVQWEAGLLRFNDNMNYTNDEDDFDSVWTAEGQNSKLIMGEERATWRAMSDEDRAAKHFFVDGIGLVKIAGFGDIVSFNED